MVHAPLVQHVKGAQNSVHALVHAVVVGRCQNVEAGIRYGVGKGVRRVEAGIIAYANIGSGKNRFQISNNQIGLVKIFFHIRKVMGKIIGSGGSVVGFVILVAVAHNVPGERKSRVGRLFARHSVFGNRDYISPNAEYFYDRVGKVEPDNGEHGHNKCRQSYIFNFSCISPSPSHTDHSPRCR